MSNSDEYTQKLENVIKQMLTPVKDIPFHLVIESLSEKKVLAFDKHDNKDNKLMNNLIKVARIAGQNINKQEIHRRRANEVGNAIEPFVKSALHEMNYNADTPKTIEGSKKSTGYPDLCFYDEYSRMIYLECKTFNNQTKATTQRSFYLSPSQNFKITEDAHHLVISYEIYIDRTENNNYVFKSNSWKFLSIKDLEVDVKYEFNSDNKRLYNDKFVLAEETL